MLKRKITKQIEEFYDKNKTGKALMIVGARQVGKTYSVCEFAASRYESVIRIDFLENPDYVRVFEGALGANDILLRLSALFGDRMIPGKTMIFFDEVQECAELITQIKYLLGEGSYDYILGGSLPGETFKSIHSAPIGYLDVVTMYPLDLEEFAWANGVGEKVIDVLRDSFEKRKPVDPFVHDRMMALFELYLIVGGMPAAVNAYLDTKNLRKVAETQNAIVRLYKRDLSRYDGNSRLHLAEIFDLIPCELNAKNKRFFVKDLDGKARLEKYADGFALLRDSGVALASYAAGELTAPLAASKSGSLFKLFANDVGLLASQYGSEIQLRILRRETALNYGAIYENAAAAELTAHGHSLYYFNDKKLGELDFVLDEGEGVVAVEIESGKDYYRRSAMDNVLRQPENEVREGCVFGGGNVGTAGKADAFPIYMLMFLQKKDLPDDFTFNADFSGLNDLV